MKRALVVAVLAAMLVGGAGSGGAQQRLDYAAVALNVLPPGQAGDFAFRPALATSPSGRPSIRPVES